MQKDLLMRDVLLRYLLKNHFQALSFYKWREGKNLRLEYEWLPPMCTKCSSFGHKYSHCPTKSTWVPTSIKLTGEGNDSKANEGKGDFEGDGN